MKFNIITLGCKVNTYESNFIKESLENNGFSFCSENSKCNILIINTCTVTDKADKKCYKLIRRLKRENKDAIFVVMGCSVQNNPEIYKELGIEIILGNQRKSKIVEILKNYLNDKVPYYFVSNDRNIDFENMMITKFDQVRCYIKIQDGCDNFCSYCIIPYVRGSIRFKNYDEILKEANVLSEKGYKEIVLTGIHTGSYHYEDKDLTDLIIDLSKIDGIERIRLSSVEITELNDKFLNMMKTNDKFCKHLHIPLQAGSNEILKKMNRKYDLKYFEDKIKSIREICPDISITTDVIVGFNYETDELFESTLQFCKKINFSKIHVFPYSKRTGTAASRMDEEVKEEVKHERARKLIKLSSLLEEEYYNKFKGQNLDILIEKNENNKSFGHTSNYLMVALEENLEVGNIYNRKIS